MTMERSGHLLVTLRPGEALDHVPAHIDCVVGACRPASRLDGGGLDRALGDAGGFRAIGVYHARESLGRVGEQHARFDDREERLGLSRTYAIQLGEPEATPRVIDGLRSSPKVESAVVQTLATAPFGAVATAIERPSVGDAWTPHERVHAREARELEPGSVDVTVGIVDTGVSLGHPEFQRKLLAGYDCVRLGLGRVAHTIRLVDDSVGADFCPRDAVGHGSHVAGVIGAYGWRLPPGLAGRSLILPIRVLAGAITGEGGGEPVGIGALPDIDAGVKICCDLGAVVLNLSFGTPASSVAAGPPPHKQVIRYATELGCTLVAASGNTGALEAFYPACLPEVIAVGSVDSNGQRSRFSTYGDHVALCAPGERIVSSSRRGYKSSSGTSYAAPFVAGAAALLVSRARRKGRNLSGAQVRALLEGSATPLGDGYSIETGHGLLNAAAALRLLDREDDSKGGEE